MPSPILEAPDESQYHKAQAELDEKVDGLNAKIVSYKFHSLSTQKELGERFQEKV